MQRIKAKVNAVFIKAKAIEKIKRGSKENVRQHFSRLVH